MSIDEDIINDKSVTIDINSNIPLFSPICSFCKNYIGYRQCRAFIEIPLEIWNGFNKHTKPIKYQRNNIVFEEEKIE